MHVLEASRIMAILQRFPHLTAFMRPLIKQTKAYKARMESVVKTRAMVSERMDTKTDRKDFMSYALNAMEKGDPDTMMSTNEIMANYEVLMLAGTETTSMSLSNVTYQLIKHPNVLKKLVAEIRTAFTASHEITITSVNKLIYQHAVLEEALRIMAPAPASSVRLVPDSGAIVGGHFVPGGYTVGIPPWAAARSPLNFQDPESFIPERWLGEDPRYAGDKREASQPFSTGPHGCIGRTLAYAEIRLIIARVLFEFDLELMESSELWQENLKCYILWQVDPLMVKLTPVIRS